MADAEERLLGEPEPKKMKMETAQLKVKNGIRNILHLLVFHFDQQIMAELHKNRELEVTADFAEGFTGCN